MGRQYSFSRTEPPPDPEVLQAVLALDTGSPLVSVAVAIEGEVVTEEAVELERSSSSLIGMIDRALRGAGLRPRQLSGLLGLQGPGSFTGLRVGLATLQGMRMALAIPTATLTTFQVLASLAPQDAALILACVDALRGEWLAQEYLPGLPPYAVTEPRRRARSELAETAPSHIIGFGVSRIQTDLGRLDHVQLIEPGPLAGQALRMLRCCSVDWRLEGVVKPLYLHPPAVSRSANPRG